MKPALLSLKRPALPEWTLRDLADPDQPDLAPFDLTLRKLDPLQQANLDAEASAFYDHWKRAGGAMPLLSGDVVEITKDVATMAAAIFLMQAGPDDSRLTLPEVVALMACLPTAWGRVQSVGLILNGAGLEDEGTQATLERLVADEDERARRRGDAKGASLRDIALRHGMLRDPDEPAPADSGDDEGNRNGASG